MKNKTDWLILAGFLLVTAGAACIYRPLGLAVAGAFCLLVARASATQPTSRNRRQDLE
jgi:hypothetical protein